MAEQVQEDDQNLWRARYTTAEGWSPGVAFADHLSVAAPALTEAGGTLYCAHRGARQEGEKRLPVRWTSFTPAVTQPFVDALAKASKPLAKGATEEQEAQRQKDIRAAAEALEEARKWTRDADAGTTARSGFKSLETPALVNDNGTLRMVFTRVDDSRHSNERGRSTSLWETHLDTSDGKAQWAAPQQIRVNASMPLAPGMAVFNGAVHLAFIDAHNEYLQHLVRTTGGEWKAVTGADGNKIPLPYRAGRITFRNGKRSYEPDVRGLDKYGWPGNVALAVHDDQLHVLTRRETGDGFYDRDKGAPAQGGFLLHAVFDGAQWSDSKFPVSSRDDGFVTASRRGAALASYDGKLHAVYPAVLSDKLIHITWTKDGGWSKPVKLEGHDSNNTPALLTYSEGPAGAERETLLLVHRGVDRYVPPTPPTPPPAPTLADVKDKSQTVIGESLTNYGGEGWSRVKHRVSLTPVTLKDGKKGLIATWEAKAEYYWGWAWYPENYSGEYRPRITFGHLWLMKGRLDSPRWVEFSGDFDSNGYFRHDAVITDLEPGTYELSVSGSKTKKDHGYWHGSRAALSDGEEDQDRFTRIHDFSAATVSATI